MVRSSLDSIYNEIKSKPEQLAKYKTFSFSDVPKLHWCGHYLDSKQNVIPDGSNCCQWHWFGLPRRWNQRHPAYPWQEQTFDEYFTQGIKLFYFGKPPKIGATQTWERIAIGEACTNPDWANGQVAIVVGTRGEEAEKKINECKEILAYKDPEGRPLRDDKGELITKLPINQDYNNKKEFSLNSVEFRAHPANNVDSIRSQPNMRMIIIDEIAFFKIVEQTQVRDAFEHYIGNSDVVIVLITTAGHEAAGVAYQIETEEPSIYHKHLYDYNIGLVVHPESKTSLYNKEYLDKVKQSPSFPRNYLRRWGHGSGNIYDSNLVDKISSLWYELKDIRQFNNCLAIDPAYGEVRKKTDSKFAAVGGWFENGKIYTRSMFELESPADDEALRRIEQEIKTYGYRNLIIDGHYTGIIKTFNRGGTSAIGVNYNEYGVSMTEEASQAVMDLSVFIHPTHESIKNQLKTITKNENGMPDKRRHRFDAGDCFQQLIWFFKRGGIKIIKV